MGKKGCKTCCPVLAQGGEAAPGQAECLTGLRRGLGLDEVDHPLGGGEILPPVQHGATGELPGLGRTGAERHEGRSDALHDGGAAVQVQLRAVLAGVGSGSGKPKHQRVVERHPGSVAERAKGSTARRWQAAREAGQEGAARRS